MRILFLASRLPYPPDRGDRLRAYHFLRNLAVDHEITLVAFISSIEERPNIENLRPFCTNIHVVLWPAWRSALAVALNIWRPLPLQALYYQSSAMRYLLADLLAEEQFDAAYIHLFRMAPFLADQHDIYRIVDLTDVISKEIALSLPYRSRFWRWLYRFELPRIRRYEQQVASQFEEAWLISQAGKQTLAALVPQANVRVIPNGVAQISRSQETAVSQPPTLLFVGHMGVFHNIDAVRYLVKEILPLVRTEIPDCRLHIVGAGVSDDIQQLENYPGVEVLGFVPDLAIKLLTSTIFVAPLRFAAGVQNKVLEAMAAALPVVATTLVNAGLQAEPERDLLLADDAPSCAAQILRLLQDDLYRETIGYAGQKFVAQQFSWHVLTRRMAALEMGVADKNP